MIKYVQSGGKRVRVEFLENKEHVIIKFAGRASQLLPEDRNDYRYTHGGALYQQACDLWWSLQK
jgi:hypothetical protein